MPSPRHPLVTPASKAGLYRHSAGLQVLLTEIRVQAGPLTHLRTLPFGTPEFEATELHSNNASLPS